jgi:hypothetical protein
MITNKAAIRRGSPPARLASRMQNGEREGGEPGDPVGVHLGLVRLAFLTLFEHLLEGDRKQQQSAGNTKRGQADA